MKKTISLLCAAVTVLSLLSCFVSCSSGKTAMEYKGYKITEGMYSYWMKSWKEYYVGYYSDINDTEEYWASENASGVTNDKYLTDQINTRISFYLIALKLFDDYDLELDDETVADIDSDINDQIEYYGSKSDFNNYLEGEYGINCNQLREIYEIESKYTTVYEYLYGTDGVKTSTPDELESYYRTYFVRIKYVMFFKNIKYKYDEDGNRVTNPSTGYYEFEELTEEEIAKVKSDMNAVYDAVSAGEDIGKYMEQYMTEFGYSSKDTPNGYYISADNYTSHTAEVTSAALEMEVGEVRKIENETCYFVVQKFELIDYAYTREPDTNQFNDLVSYSNSLKFTTEFNGYIGDVVYVNEITDKYTMSKI